MPPRNAQAALPLPRGWREITRVGVLHGAGAHKVPAGTELGLLVHIFVNSPG